MKINKEETFASLITPKGLGGIAVIQVIGEDPIKLIETNFVTKKKLKYSDDIYYGYIYENNNLIDEVLISLYSEKNKNVLEINCHGGKICAESILSLLRKKGTQILTCNNFIKKNLILDNLQKKALIYLLESKTELAAKMFIYQLNGALKKEIEKIFNFIDKKNIEEAINIIDNLLRSFYIAKKLIYPTKVAIAGPPNAGKSTLINKLLGRDRMIVHEQPGTTRDSISEIIEINGFPFEFFDMAGLRETTNFIESLGNNLAKQKIKEADKIIWIFDINEKNTCNIENYIDKEKDNIIVFNKIDLNNLKLEICNKFKDYITISAKTGEGIDKLKNIITSNLILPKNNEALIFTENQRLNLEKAKELILEKELKKAKNYIYEILK